MDETRLNRLRATAGVFRDAIEACDSGALPEWFDSFPLGCCGDATELLARYLEEEGFGSFRYICGYCRGEDSQEVSHAWLQQGDVTVDITADQFRGGRERVSVESDSGWHKSFEIRVDHLCDYRADPHARALLDGAYEAILRVIKSRGT